VSQTTDSKISGTRDDVDRSNLLLAIIKQISGVIGFFTVATLAAHFWHLDWCGGLRQITSAWDVNVRPVIHDAFHTVLAAIRLNVRLPAVVLDYLAVGLVMIVSSFKVGVLSDMIFFVRHERDKSFSWFVSGIMAVVAFFFSIVVVVIFWPVVILVTLLEMIPFVGARFAYFQVKLQLGERVISSIAESPSSPRFRALLARRRRKNLLVLAPLIWFAAALFVNSIFLQSSCH
jgi:hypothetical protein